MPRACSCAFPSPPGRVNTILASHWTTHMACKELYTPPSLCNLPLGRSLVSLLFEPHSICFQAALYPPFQSLVWLLQIFILAHNMRNGFINLLVSLLLFYALIFSFTSRSIKVKVRFFSPFFLFYTSHPCVYSLSDFSLLPLVFPLSPQLPCLVISNNHLNSLTAEGSLLSSSRKQDTDLSVRRHLKYS